MMHRQRLIRGLAALFILAIAALLAVPFATRSTSAEEFSLELLGIAEGQTLSGTAVIEARANVELSEVRFTIGGPQALEHSELELPYFLMGDNGGLANGWDTQTVPDGQYSLQVMAVSSQGQQVTRTVNFWVANILAQSAAAEAGLLLYGDALSGNIANWSWNTSVDPANTRIVQEGGAALAATYNQAWAGLFLRTSTIDLSGYTALRFWIHGGDGVGSIALSTRDGADTRSNKVVLTPQSGTWSEMIVPLSDLGGFSTLSSIIWQEASGRAQPTFYLDKIELIGAAVPPQPTATAVPTTQPTATAVPTTQPTAQPTATAVPTTQPTAQPTATAMPPAQPTATLPPSTPVPVPGGARTFVETFDGTPAQAQPWKPAAWDVTVHSRDATSRYSLPPMEAAHGRDCAAPPATHTITSYEDVVFICRNHVMTAINGAGYGATVLTPNQLLDFSQGEAVLRFDMSTHRTAGRDWIEIWLSPYNDQIQIPANISADLNGPPSRGVALRMTRDLGKTYFEAFQVNNFAMTKLPQASFTPYERVFTPDAARRDTFELRISRDRVVFGMPAYNLWWVNTSMPALDWSQAVVQLSHHTYTPTKCDPGPCGPNTWHWDNVSLSPARPFSMLRADRRYVDGKSTEQFVRLPAPAPANAFLRFSGIGENLEVSFDGGRSWQTAVIQRQAMYSRNKFRSYWTPIPAGATSVHFRGLPFYGGTWHARDITVWGPPSQ